MPVTPSYEWEESEDQVVVYVRPKGVGPDKVDVYTTSALLKVNAERYLLAIDLRHDVVHAKTSFRKYASGMVAVTMEKQEPGVIWGELKAEGDPDRLKERREKSIRDREDVYDRRLKLRKATKEAEEKRYFNQHWDLEKAQRQEVEERVLEEYQKETGDLYVWEEEIEAAGVAQRDAATLATTATPAPAAPADILSLADDVAQLVAAVKGAPSGSARQDNAIWGPTKQGMAAIYAPTTPAVRDRETVTVPIHFTPSISKTAPARGSHDQETYHQSRYKPKNATDTPYHFKEAGDQLYRQRKWKQAADSYSEALKRDATFMTALCNRSACWLRLHQYRKCIDDANLALNLIGSSPASSTTAERYRYFMVKMLARRGAAHIWGGDLVEGLNDYRVALSYKIDESIDIAIDLQTVEEFMHAKGLVVERELTEAEVLRYEGDRAFHMQRYQEAVDSYTKAYAADPSSWESLANRAAACLSMQEFSLAIADCDSIIRHCADVAQALAELQRVEHQDDSDDEDGAAKETSNAELVKSSTKNVYRLLKAYVRKGAALCGLGEYYDGLHWFERALAIVPYDNDLRDDCHALAEKVRTDTLITASGGTVKRPPHKASSAPPEKPSVAMEECAPEGSAGAAEAEAEAASVPAPKTPKKHVHWQDGPPDTRQL